MPEPAPMQELLSREWNRGLTWRAFLDFSQKNVEKMRENYVGAEIEADAAEEIKALKGEVRLLVLGGDWCGDVIANVPAVARLAELNPRVQLRVLDRDRHMELMEKFQTNGANAVPIVIAAPADFARHARWGPRPGACQAIMTENKGKMPKEDIFPMIRAWYEADRSRTVAKEILAAIREATA